jgi:hypothetical protein
LEEPGLQADMVFDMMVQNLLAALLRERRTRRRAKGQPSR